MSEVADRFLRAADEFDRRVQQIRDDQWGVPTPCTEWDVRALVNHLVYEHVWFAPLMEGRTVEEIGDRFEGDNLGDDPLGAWKRAIEESRRIAAEPGAFDRTVHLSRGPTPAAEYAAEMTADNLIHAWDLAHAIGADERLDPQLVEWTSGWMAPKVDEWRGYGVFAGAVEIGDDADAQAKLLAMSGRDPRG